LNTSNLLKLGLAVVMLGAAGFFLVRFFRQDDGVSEKTYFYDVSEKKLFTAPRTSVPPIKGISDAVEDGVRAVVISTTGNCRDKSSLKVAYLETFSPELKQQMETAQRTGGSPLMSRAMALGHRLVKRPTDANWFPMDSPDAERILNEWATPGPNGLTPVVCAP
jgi:hypothetical protein